MRQAESKNARLFPGRQILMPEDPATQHSVKLKLGTVLIVQYSTGQYSSSRV